jgi:hypothetical protein
MTESNDTHAPLSAEELKRLRDQVSGVGLTGAGPGERDMMQCAKLLVLEHAARTAERDRLERGLAERTRERDDRLSPEAFRAYVDRAADDAIATMGELNEARAQLAEAHTRIAELSASLEPGAWVSAAAHAAVCAQRDEAQHKAKWLQQALKAYAEQSQPCDCHVYKTVRSLFGAPPAPSAPATSASEACTGCERSATTYGGVGNGKVLCIRCMADAYNKERNARVALMDGADDVVNGRGDDRLRLARAHTSAMYLDRAPARREPEPGAFHCNARPRCESQCTVCSFAPPAPREPAPVFVDEPDPDTGCYECGHLLECPQHREPAPQRCDCCGFAPCRVVTGYEAHEPAPEPTAICGDCNGFGTYHREHVEYVCGTCNGSGATQGREPPPEPVVTHDRAMQAVDMPGSADDYEPKVTLRSYIRQQAARERKAADYERRVADAMRQLLYARNRVVDATLALEQAFGARPEHTKGGSHE